MGESIHRETRVAVVTDAGAETEANADVGTDVNVDADAVDVPVVVVATDEEPAERAVSDDAAAFVHADGPVTTLVPERIREVVGEESDDEARFEFTGVPSG